MNPADFPYGCIEHVVDGVKCRHKVVRLTATLVEFVRRCDRRLAFGESVTVVALREQFRRKLVRLAVNGVESTARFVDRAQLDREAETPEQRAERLARARETLALNYRGQCRGALFGADDDLAAEYEPRIAAMVEAIRRGERCAGAKHREALLHAIERDVRARNFAFHCGRPWFVDALGLPAWPCDARAVKSAFAARALKTHPDHGGTDKAFIAVMRARDEALRAVEGGA